MKQHGVKDYIVDEWDAFELEREEYKIKKGEKEMAKFRMIVRLSKDFNNAEIGIEDAETVEELLSYEEWMKSKVQQLVEQLPTYKKENPVKNYTPKQYVQEKTQNFTNKKVTLSDLRISQGSEKQKKFLVDGINKGYFTLDAINRIETYQQVSEYVKDYFSRGK